MTSNNSYWPFRWLYGNFYMKASSQGFNLSGIVGGVIFGFDDVFNSTWRMTRAGEEYSPKDFHLALWRELQASALTPFPTIGAQWHSADAGMIPASIRCNCSSSCTFVSRTRMNPNYDLQQSGHISLGTCQMQT